MGKKLVVELVKEFPSKKKTGRKKNGEKQKGYKKVALKAGLCRGVMVLLVLPRPTPGPRGGLGTLGLNVQVPAQRGFWGQRGGLRGFGIPKSSMVFVDFSRDFPVK